MSPIVEHVEVDGVALEIEQQPLVPWTRWVVPPLALAGALVTWKAPLVAPLAASIVVAAALAGRWRAKLRIEATPARIRIVGWLGALPLPDDRAFPITGTRLEAEDGPRTLAGPLATARFDFAGEQVAATALRTSRAGLARVRERIEAQRALGARVRRAE